MGSYTGFQSACAEYSEDVLSLDKKFVTDPPATFYIRVKEDARPLGLKKGDILQVNRALAPRQGQVVVAVLSNEFTLGAYELREGVGYLWPYNRRLGGDDFNDDFVWGVVQSLHRPLA